jgi:hypothetical protein
MLQVDSPGFVRWAQEVVAAAGMAPVRAMLQVAGVLAQLRVLRTVETDRVYV